MPWLTVKWKIKVMANSGKIGLEYEFPWQLVISVLLPYLHKRSHNVPWELGVMRMMEKGLLLPFSQMPRPLLLPCFPCRCGGGSWMSVPFSPESMPGFFPSSCTRVSEEDWSPWRSSGRMLIVPGLVSRLLVTICVTLDKLTVVSQNLLICKLEHKF